MSVIELEELGAHPLLCGAVWKHAGSLMNKAFFLSLLTISLWYFLTQKRDITKIHNA